MGRLGALLVVASAVLVSGCETGSPVPSVTTPTSIAPPAAPAPSPGPVPNWNLVTVLEAVTGPDSCFIQQQQQLGIPRSTLELMEVVRTGTTVVFDHDTRNFPNNDLQEAGTLVGNEFTARSETLPVSFPSCPDATMLKGTFDASVSGRFSDDGTHIAAREIWAYHFSSGEVAFVIDWSADQR